MAQEYPGLVSAFEVFSSKSATKKKTPKSKSLASAGEVPRTTPSRHEVARAKHVRKGNVAVVNKFPNAQGVQPVLANNSALNDSSADVEVVEVEILRSSTKKKTPKSKLSASAGEPPRTSPSRHEGVRTKQARKSNAAVVDKFPDKAEIQPVLTYNGTLDDSSADEEVVDEEMLQSATKKKTPKPKLSASAGELPLTTSSRREVVKTKQAQKGNAAVADTFPNTQGVQPVLSNNDTLDDSLADDVGVKEEMDEVQIIDITKSRKRKKSVDRDVSVLERPVNGVVEPASPLKKRKVKGVVKSKKIVHDGIEYDDPAESTFDGVENGEDAIPVKVGLAKKKKKVGMEGDDSKPAVAGAKVKKTKKLLSMGEVKVKNQQVKGKRRVKVSSRASEGPGAESQDAPGAAPVPVRSTDSVQEGKQLFAWLLDPITPEDFFRDTWEQRPLMIERRQPDFYQALVSTPAIHRMLERDNLQFTKNVDVTSYCDGKRETHNPEGRALPAVVWGHYAAGCSVRLLNPQTFVPKLHLLNATLQEYFGCFVGANAYLTPPRSQGFAPHYDDIEAFILQLEGQKEWKLYAPRTQQEYLPRFSSDNLTDDTIGEPIMNVLLKPGDLLYFPRGTIHQGRTLDEHSLHITLSCYQRNTWGDLLEKAIPAALRYAMEEEVELRRGLPVDYLRYMGSVHSDRELSERSAFTQKLHGLVDKVFQYLPLDAVADQMGKQFMHDALPPVLTVAEKKCTVFGDGLKMTENGKLSGSEEMDVNTRIKLLRAHVLRLVVEDEEVVRLYHCVDNSLEYHGNEPQYLELPLEAAPAVEQLILSYPEFVTVGSLPQDSDAEKLDLARQLWQRGLLLTDRPLHFAQVSD